MYKTLRHCIQKHTYSEEDGKLTMSEGVDERRKIISVFNTVERLNKHPTVYLNYLKLLVESKGMLFTVDKESLPEDSAYNSSRDSEKDYKMESILNAQNITDIEYEQIDKRKKKGQTTTEENNQCQRHYYKKLLALDELKPEDLKAFVYGNDPLKNFLGLVDIEIP